MVGQGRGWMRSAAALGFARRAVVYPLGIGAAAAFVVDGYIANSILFDTSRGPHDLANVVLALAVALSLAKGRRALGPPAS